MIPVLRPKLPETEAILPYLRQIDANRWYGNDGPLVKAFEARTASMINAAVGQVVMVANGTLGLMVALQAVEMARGSYCLMPSWTFTATPAAALAAGLQPYFMDVDKDTQILSPDMVKAHLKTMKKPPGVVVAVSPFGAPLNVAAWDRFTEETGIPVVIDAAAAFDSFASGKMHIGRTPVMVSLHATKIAGIGEGGLMLSTSNDLLFRMRRLINFGFESDRLSHRIAINAKASEYNAASGMAMLDRWPDIRAAWSAVHQRYIDAFAQAGVLHCMRSDMATSTCNVLLPHYAAEAAAQLRAQGIDCRRWWETGCHAHPAYRHCPTQNNLPATQWLGQSVLGIPAAMDMPLADQETVIAAVTRIAQQLQSLREPAYGPR